MKKIFIFFSLISSITMAKAELPTSTMKDLEIFSNKTLNAKTDLDEVKKNLNILLLLESEDPSRTAVFMLSESYQKNKALYDKAFKEIETKKNKSQLIEIKKIMSRFSQKGNG